MVHGAIYGAEKVELYIHDDKSSIKAKHLNNEKVKYSRTSKAEWARLLT